MVVPATPVGGAEEQPREAPAAAALAVRSQVLAILVFVVLGAALVRVARVAEWQLGAPFDLAYETASLATVELLREGRDPYDERTYAQPPFVLTMYTPLYPLLVAALPAAPDNPFTSARLVALVCMLGAAAVPFVVHGRRAGIAVPALAAALLLLHWPVSRYVAYVKHDALALLLSALAVAVLPAPGGRAWRHVAAGLLCVLAVATKQSYVAASVACLAWLLVADRRGALRFAVTAGALGLGLAAFAHLAWGPGFWFSTIVAPDNPMNAEQAAMVLRRIGHQPLARIAPVVLVAAVLVALRRRGAGAWRATPYPLYALGAIAVLAATVAKEGSNTNYLFEPLLALLLCWTAAWRDRPAAELARGTGALLTGVLLLAAGWELLAARPDQYAFTDPERAPQRVALERAMRRRMVAIGGPDPTVLDVYSPIHTYGIQRSALVNDTLLYRLLWQAGKLDVAPLVDAVRARAFDVVLLPRGAAEAMSAERPGPIDHIARAALETYQRRGSNAFYDFYGR